MVRVPGSGYGFDLNMLGAAIQRFAISRLKQSGPWAVYRTIRSIERYYFGATASQIATIREKGEMAYQSGLRMTGLIKNANQVPRANIPVDTSLPKGVAYRIKVLVKGTDPQLKGDVYQTVTIDYARNPTAEMVKASIAKLADTLPEHASPYEKWTYNAFKNMTIDRVVSMVRRTY